MEKEQKVEERKEGKTSQVLSSLHSPADFHATLDSETQRWRRRMTRKLRTWKRKRESWRLLHTARKPVIQSEEELDNDDTAMKTTKQSYSYF